MHINETELIARVKNHNDSDELQVLVRKYQPMIDRMYKMYWLNGYDRNDWYQESFLVCFTTCQIFSGKQGSKFASFFKMRFKNHIISLIRAQRANKRQANNDVCSFEELILNEDDSIEFLSRPTPEVSEVMAIFQKLIGELSDLELVAFRVIIGTLTVEEVCRVYNCNYQQVLRASSRCRSKIRNQFLDK